MDVPTYLHLHVPRYTYVHMFSLSLCVGTPSLSLYLSITPPPLNFISLFLSSNTLCANVRGGECERERFRVCKKEREREFWDKTFFCLLQPCSKLIFQGHHPERQHPRSFVRSFFLFLTHPLAFFTLTHWRRNTLNRQTLAAKSLFWFFKWAIFSARNLEKWDFVLCWDIFALLHPC